MFTLNSRSTVLVGLGLCTFFLSCSSPKQEARQAPVLEEEKVNFPELVKELTIYEVNIRQYTPEGTLKAFEAHLPRLQAMGVGILWVMPIQPIGIEKRKEGPEDLGSYYSIRDYTAVHSEYGNVEDFKALVKKAHAMGMYVILDWVANHTAWDHHWIEERPDFYTKDSLGAIVAPNPDWEDVADLDYDNEALHTAMIEEMLFWVKTANIDGFRCDVAGEVPMVFWNKAKKALDKEKDLFMLAEWDEPKMHRDAFHMSYGWTFHHLLNAIAKKEANADSIDAYLDKYTATYALEDIKMNFTSNHDENAWNGTVYERFGEGAETFAVLASTLQGMPLIYGGQEAGMDERLPFFTKGEIDWSELELADFYTTLIRLKKENKALWNGEYGGPVQRINTKGASEHVYAFYREREGNRVTVLLNLSDEPQSFQIGDKGSFGTHRDVFTQQDIKISKDEDFPLEAWGYSVFVD